MNALVNVCGDTFRVRTSRIYGAGWIAAGDYMGQHIECRGRTKPGAVARWREYAVGLRMGLTASSATTGGKQHAQWNRIHAGDDRIRR